MPHKRLVAAVSVGVLSIAGAAYADHAMQVDPATVPLGVFAGHTRVANISTTALQEATRRNRADVTIQHNRLEPNQASPWHTHPGPGIVTVARGSLTYEDAVEGECRELFYRDGQGFMDRGFGHVHRVVAGNEGADLYVVYIHPRGVGNPQLPGTEPAECAP